MEEAEERSFQAPRQVFFEAESGYLVLRLERDFGGLPDTEVVFKGKVFKPKEELHITIVSREAAEKMKAHLEARPEDREVVETLIEAADWTYRKGSQYFHVREEPEVETLIQMAEVRGLDPFYRRISRLIGHKLELPPTHITLYTRGTERGIGLPDSKVFGQLAQGPFEPAALAAAEGGRAASGG
jgi:hypothetical protein